MIFEKKKKLLQSGDRKLHVGRDVYDELRFNTKNVHLYQNIQFGKWIN